MADPRAAQSESPSADPPSAPRTARTPWTDRWILDAMRQQGHAVADKVQSAETAWEALLSAGAAAKDVMDVVCGVTGCEPVDLSAVDASAAALLTPVHAKRYGVVPVRRTGAELLVATPNPLVAHLERDLAFATGLRIRIGVASPPEFRAARERVYGVTRSTIQVRLRRLEWTGKNATDATAGAQRGAIVELLDHIVSDALDVRASDIHFEPKELDLLVRFRVDGILHDATRVSADLAPLLVSRIKVLAGLDIADRRRPQDGRASARFDGRLVDLRVSTLPLGDRAEKAVVRLLDAQAARLGLHALGFSQAESFRVHQLLDAREGVVLVTGPTGCGKTTTLYAAIEHRRSSEANIVTVEDPIEYELEGINQVQVNDRAGLGFADALRSILRQDPDVILVGEIRDAETAQVAIKAGLTGHLVLSTLHTMDAPSAISRLADIGTDLSALSGALKGVIAQRLIRRLCDACAKPVELADLPHNQQLLLVGRKTTKLRTAVGCSACRNTGYRSRMVVPEILVVTDEMQAAIAKGGTRATLDEIARRGGMKSMWDSGLHRVLDGTTSITELLDAISAPMQEESGAQESVDAIVARLTGAAASAPSGTSVSLAAAGPAAMPAAPAVASAGAPAAASRPTPIVATRAVAPPKPRVARKLPVDAPRVLVVHDDRSEREVIRAALEEQGCAVIEASDGESGLRYARYLRPQAVVTELTLPRLDGVGLLQAVTGELGMPCVVYTSQRDEALRRWATTAGASDIVGDEEGAAVLAGRVFGFLAPSPVRLAQ